MQIEVIKIIVWILISLTIIFYLFFNIKTPNNKQVVTTNLIGSMFVLVWIISLVVLFLNKTFSYSIDALILSSIISFLSLFFWFFIIERFDVFKESMSRTLVFFAFAIFFMLISNLIYLNLWANLESVFIKAMIEEIMKFWLLEMFLYYENERMTYDGFIDAFILALIVSASFFFIENILYFANSFEASGIASESNTQLIWRILISDLAHIIFTGITAVWVILAFFNSNLNKTKLEHNKNKNIKNLDENNINKEEEKKWWFQTSLIADKQLINDNLAFNYKKFSFISLLKNFIFNNLFIKIIFYSDMSDINLNLSKFSRLEIIIQMFIMAVVSHFLFNIIAWVNFILLSLFAALLAVFYFKAIILFRNILDLDRKNII